MNYLTRLAGKLDGFSKTVYSTLTILCLTVVFTLFAFGSFAINQKLYFPTQTSQFIFFNRAIVILFLLLLLLFLNGKKINKIEISPIDWLVFTVIVFISVSSYLTYKIFPTNFVNVVSLFILYLVLRTFYSYYFIVAIFISVICQAIYGTLQLHNILPSYNDLFKITGSFFNPSPFAGFLVLVLPFSFGFYVYRNEIRVNDILKKTLSTLSILSSLVIISIIPSTESRASWLAGIFSILYILYTHPTFQKKISSYHSGKLKIVSGVVVLSLILTILCFYLFKRDSADGRLLVWKTSLKMIQDKPLVGHGYGQFKAKYMEYQSAYFANHQRSDKEVLLSDNVQYAYNEGLHITVELGFLGLLLVGLIVYYAFRIVPLKEEYKNLVFIARSGLVSFIVFSMFSYPSEIIPSLAILVFYLSIIATFSKKWIIPISKKNIVNSLFLRLSTGATACFLLIPSAWFHLNSLEKSFMAWKAADSFYVIGNYKKSLEYYENIYPDLIGNGLYLSHYGKALSMLEKFDSSLDIIDQSRKYHSDSFTYLTLGDDYNGKGEYTMAQDSYEKSYNMIPSHIYPLYCLVKLHKKQGNFLMANAEGKKALNLKIKVESDGINEMRNKIKELIEK